MNRHRNLAVAALTTLLAISAWQVRGGHIAQEQTVARAPVEFPAATFRITLGVGATKPEAWDGEVTGAEGQVLELEGDELRLHKYAGAGGESGPDPELPNDQVRGHRFIASTRPAPRRRADSPLVIEAPSVLVHLRSGLETRPIEVRTVRGTFRFTPAELPLFRSASSLDGKVRVERIPPVADAAPEQLGQQDMPALCVSGSGDLWVAWQEFDGAADGVVARRKGNVGWEPASRLESGRDVFGVAAAADGRGRVWVTWSMQVDGNWDLYGRFHDGRAWSRTERLTSAAAPDLFHRATRDGLGRLWLVWLRPVAGGRSTVFARRYDGGSWSAEEEVSSGNAAAGNAWFPAVAGGPTGVAVAWDAYVDGSYDVFVRRFSNNRWEAVEPVAATPLFEAEPSVAIDPQNRVWIAWIESGPNWGKDTGKLPTRKGTGLYDSRTIRVACLDGGRRLEPAGRLEAALGPAEYWEAPVLAATPGGLSLLVRHMRTRQSDMRATHAAGAVYWPLWELYLTRYEGGAWKAPVRLPRTGGRNDGRAAAAVDGAGSLWFAWATDLRDTKDYLPKQHRVSLTRIDAIGAASAGMELVSARAAVPPAAEPIHPREREQVARIRSYRIDHAGKRFAIYRGDLHRHTEISIDGGRDGSLFDTYRYGRDAAALDFLGVTDHTHDVVEPYAWWRSQKTADLFQIRDAFAAFYAYERSVEYPNGHRNIVFVRRGAEVLPIEYDEANGWAGAERLFWYLRRHRGTSIPHTSGTASGTDWRDNDPKVENLVEIFQGMRDTYEYPGAPSPKTLAPSPASRSQSAGLRPLGFVWSALAKGYRLGFIASSDHMSTHISYACLVAENLTLESLREAMQARRAYAATDNIVLDARFIGSDGEHLMGGEFASSAPVRIRARVVGTAPVSRVDVVRNGAIVYTTGPNTSEVEFNYADAAPPSGEAYYYVRVMQADGEMAWGSPAFVRYVK